MYKVNLDTPFVFFKGGQVQTTIQKEDTPKPIFEDVLGDLDASSSLTVKGVPIKKQHVLKGTEYLIRGVRIGNSVNKKVEKYKTKQKVDNIG